MTEFAPAIRTNTAIVLALAERSCSRGAIVRATRFHVPQLSSTRGSPRPLCRIRTSALPSPKSALQRFEPGARAGLCGTTQMPAISIEGDDFGRGSLVPRLAQRTLWLVVGRRVRLDLLVLRFRNNVPMTSGCIIDFVPPGVDDWLAIDVADEGHQAFPEFVFGGDADVAQH